jgi:ribosome biogenesis GTPase A
MVEPNHPSKVQPGLLVRIEISYQTESELHAFVIVPDDQADFNAGFLGESTLLAQAILGEPVGIEIPYLVGDALSVRIIEIETTNLSPSNEIASRREKKLQDVVKQIERTNAIIFASSFTGKLGDYDPEGIESWDPNTAESTSSTE